MGEGDISIFSFFIVVFLLFANGFFVASEFALVKIRQTRLMQLSNEGDKNAKIALKATKDLDKYLAATQLGITIASIGIGWLAEPALATLFLPLFDFIPWIEVQSATAHTIAITVAFVLITLLHVVIGELMPKSIALQYTEKTALLVARPMNFATTIFSPFIWILNGIGNALLKLIHVEPAPSKGHSTEELNILIDKSFDDGEINETEKDMIQNVFKFSDLTAKQVMVPRTDITCIPIDITMDELNKINGYSDTASNEMITFLLINKLGIHPNSPTPPSQERELFESFLDEMFIEYLQEDAFTTHFTLQHPEKYGIVFDETFADGWK